MGDKAIELAGKGHKVVFAVFIEHNIKQEPMLFIDLEYKFKDYKNIEVVLIPINRKKKNNLEEITKGAKYFFGDEFPDSFEFFEKSVKKEFIKFIDSRDFAWLTLSNSSGKENRNDDFKSYVERWKPQGFEIIALKTPLRMPSKLAEGLKKILSPG